MSDKKVCLPYSVYRNVVDHLTVHASTDSWAESCLEQLKSESEIREPEDLAKSTSTTGGVEYTITREN